MLETAPTARTIGSRTSLWQRVRDLISYRELLVNLVRKELKVKYKSSVLGFLWSLLNPAFLLVVYYLVFSVVLGSGIPRFAIYLLSGLLAWNLFNVAAISATGSIVSNAGIVNKVWFPREVLPLASIGAALVHFFLQLIILVLALGVFRHPVSWSYVPLVPVALIVLLLFLSAVAILAAAANVYLRDIQHLMELALLAWFFSTPIVYTYQTIAAKLGRFSFLYLLNPMTDVVLVFQRAIYGTSLKDGNGNSVLQAFPYHWYVRNLAIVAAASLVLVVIALAIFRRLEGDFTEEL